MAKVSPYGEGVGWVLKVNSLPLRTGLDSLHCQFEILFRVHRNTAFISGSRQTNHLSTGKQFVLLTELE
jgi:hypothetical protein